MQTRTYSDYIRLRRQEAPSRLVFAALLAAMGWLLTRELFPLAWFVAVVVGQVTEAAFFAKDRDRRDADFSYPYRAFYAGALLVNAVIYCALSVYLWLSGTLPAMLFGVLLSAGTLLNLAISMERAPRLMFLSWAPHASVVILMPILYARLHPELDFAGMLCAAAGGVVYVGHMRTAVRKSAKRAAELSTAVDTIRREHTVLDTVVNLLPVGVMVKEASTGRFLKVNRAAETIVGLPRQAAVGGMPEDFLSPEVAAVLRASDAAALASGRTQHEDLESEGSDGRRYFKSSKVATQGEAGPEHLVVVVQEVTEERRAAEELRTALAAAEAASHAKSTFLANMSHEIRTPLNGVLGMAQVMERDARGALERERLKVIRTSGQTLLSLLNDVLDFSKIEAGRLELESHPFDVEALVTEACSLFRTLAEQKDLYLDVEIAPDAVGVWQGDSSRLRQVIGNLVSNAVKFTDAGGIQVKVSTVEQRLMFAVEDTGIGIAPETQARLFAEFIQADPTVSRLRGGSGLGLAISRELVSLMGGTLSVTSALGEGSRFAFTLDLPRTEAAPVVSAHSRRDTAPDRRLRILAAEDNDTNRLILRSLLEPFDVDLVFACDGQEALEAYATCDFDLVLMDIQMPRLDGIEATRAIREMEAARRAPRTPVIALTANAMSHQVEAYLQSGFDTHVAKPLELGKLLDAIHRVTEAAQAPADDVDDAVLAQSA